MTVKANFFQTNVSPLVDARDDRRQLRSRFNAGGVITAGDFAVSQYTSGTTMQVQVGACANGGGLVVAGTDLHQGSYFMYNDAPVLLPISPSDAINPRRDIVVARIYDDEIVPGAGFAGTVEVIQGTPAASPVDPTLPRDCVSLARVVVAANVTNITNAAITDLRQNPSGASRRGIIVSGPATVNPANGAPITLNNVIDGAAGWLAANTITIPLGAGGLYLLSLDISMVANTLVNSVEVRDGTNTSLGMVVQSVGFQTSANVRHSGSWARTFPGGQTLRVCHNYATTTATDQVYRFSVIRIGDALATT